MSLILATGGEGMVRAAYASGTPTISGGPGNGPAFIERSADIHQAVKDIITSKTFDNGVICASEQSIIVERCIYDEVHRELAAQGAYFMNEDEAAKMAALLLRRTAPSTRSGGQDGAPSQPAGRFQRPPAPACWWQN